jgi:hypothetical protein
MQTHIDALKSIMIGAEEYDEMVSELENAEYDECEVDEIKHVWDALQETPIVLLLASKYLMRTNDMSVAAHIKAIHAELTMLKERYANKNETVAGDIDKTNNHGELTDQN